MSIVVLGSWYLYPGVLWPIERSGYRSDLQPTEFRGHLVVIFCSILL